MKSVLIIFLVILSITVFSACKNDNDLKMRIESYLNETFNDQKILDVHNLSEKDFSKFVLHLAIYKGTVHKRPTQIGEGLTLQQIEENIYGITGNNALLLRVNYDYIPADYDEKNKIFIPCVYGAPSYGLHYVIHKIKHLSDNNYEVIISYIDTNAFISTFDPDGNKIIVDYTEITDESGSSVESRKKAMSDLETEILKNPEKYERINLLLEIRDEHIYYKGATTIIN